MAALVLVSVGCVLLGGLLAALPRVGPRVLGPTRTFALCAVLGVVALHLIPEALDRLRWLGVLLFALGFGLPALAEHFGPRASGHRLGAELGFAGLLLHQLSDGLTLWATARGKQPTVDVALALFAHSTPLAALVFLRFEPMAGRRAALFRVLALALSAALGVGLGKYAAALAPDSWVPFTGALAAGLLLHMFAHDLTVDAPHTKRQRFVDFAAAGLGVFLSLVGLEAHASVDPHTAELAHTLGKVLLKLTVLAAPMLLLGLSLGALMQTLRPRVPTGWIHGGSSLSQALRGVAIGAPLPVCACGVLPIAESLTARGAGASLVVSFLLMTPELGVDTLLLTARMFGLPFALVRLAGATLLSVLAALVLAKVARHRGERGTTELTGEHGHGDFVQRFVHTFDDLFHHTGPWIAVGLLVAAYLEVVLPAETFAGLPLGVDLALVTLLTLPSYVCATSATPLGFVLLTKGMSVGAVFTGLVLGPIANLATFGFLSRAFGRTAAVAGALALLVGSWLLAWGLNRWLFKGGDLLNLSSGPESHDLWSQLATLLLVLLLSRSVWRVGTRRWLASLGSTDHVHAHVRAVDAG